MKQPKSSRFFLAFFLIAEAILYIHLLLTNNPFSMFGSILLCCIFACCHGNKTNRFLIIGLVFTVAADVCLVLCSPQQRLLGMIFFLLVQCAYAIHLQLMRRNTVCWYVRIGFILVAEFITVLVLRENTDALALISLAYYANLIVNLVEGFSQFQTRRLFPLGLVFFLLCDTVIGLQVAAQDYLAVSNTSLLYLLLYPGFNLAWFFYLPSQVLLALSARCRKS